jgi:prophage regulatory protein
VNDDATAGADYLYAPQLQQWTGTPASTWRYWAHIGSGPPSFKIGRRRVWERLTVQAWLDEQKAQTTRGGDEQVPPVVSIPDNSGAA